MRILEKFCMLPTKTLKTRAVKDTMVLVAHSTGGTQCASAQMSWHLWHPAPALLNWQGVGTHPKMDNGPEKARRPSQLPTQHCDAVLQLSVECLGGRMKLQTSAERPGTHASSASTHLKSITSCTLIQRHRMQGHTRSIHT